MSYAPAPSTYLENRGRNGKKMLRFRTDFIPTKVLEGVPVLRDDGLGVDSSLPLRVAVLRESRLSSTRKGRVSGRPSVPV